MAQDEKEIPGSCIDVATGQRVFYHDQEAQLRYERRLHLLGVVKQSLARRAEGKRKPPTQS